MDGSLFVLCRLFASLNDDCLVRCDDTHADHHATDDAYDVSRRFCVFVKHEGRLVTIREVKLPCAQVSNDSKFAVESRRVPPELKAYLKTLRIPR